jgi:hypothetical protein
MRQEQIKVGGFYLAKIGDRTVTVQVNAIDYVGDGFRVGGHGRKGRRNTRAYRVTNIATGRGYTFNSAAKFIIPAEVNA